MTRTVALKVETGLSLLRDDMDEGPMGNEKSETHRNEGNLLLAS